MKNIIKKILREQFQSPDYLKRVSNILLQSGPPYFQLMEDNFGVTDYNDQVEVLRYIYGNDIKKVGMSIYNSNNKSIYFETTDGYWEKEEYDSNNRKIYYDDSKGRWLKWIYDSNGNKIYYENWKGYIEDYR